MGLKKAYDDLQKFQLKNDSDGSIGVQYDDGSPGVLRTPNAGMRVEADGFKLSGRGLEMRYNGSVGIVRTRDADNGSHVPLLLQGESGTGIKVDSGKIDLSSSGSPDLRLATNQFIEDGNGTSRMELNGNVTRIFGETGAERIAVNDSTHLNLHAQNGSPVEIKDDEGGFNAVEYRTSASAPGTLNVPNATINVGSPYRTPEALNVDGGISSSGDSSTSVISQFGKSVKTPSSPYVACRIRQHGNQQGGVARETLEIRSEIDPNSDNATGFISLGEGTASNHVLTDYLKLNPFGPVELPNSDLRLDTGQAIQDSVERIRFDSDGTYIDNNDGEQHVRAGNGVFSLHIHNNHPLNVIDEVGGFKAYEYDAVSSRPGKLELTNSKLIVGLGDRFDLNVIDSFRGVGGDENTSYQQRNAIWIFSDRTITGRSQKIQFDDNSGTDEEAEDHPAIFADDGEMLVRDSQDNVTTIS